MKFGELIKSINKIGKSRKDLNNCKKMNKVTHLMTRIAHYTKIVNRNDQIINKIVDLASIQEIFLEKNPHEISL